MRNFPAVHNEEKFRPEQIRRFRKSRKENQTEFWERFGVTQSRGSRFELGMELPHPVAILVKLYLEGTITDRDLQRARFSMTASGNPSGRQLSVSGESLAA